MTKRQNLILKIIVETFVKFGKPISSKAIFFQKKVFFSAATIRQEMKTLQDLGFLEKVHSQGGSVPTTNGIQYYVDNLMIESAITLSKKLNKLFSKRDDNINQVLSKTSQFIAEITNLATVVVGPSRNDKFLEKIELNKLSNSSLVIILITNHGDVYNKVFKVDEQNKFLIADLEKLIIILNNMLKNTLVNQINKKLKAIMPVIKNEVQNLEALFQNFIYQIIASLTKVPEFSSGAFNIALYENVDKKKIKKLIGIIESHSTFDQFIKQQNKDIVVGKDGTSIIKHEYNIKGEKGHIALIGPTRMEYKKVNSLLDKVVAKIEKLYKE